MILQRFLECAYITECLQGSCKNRVILQVHKNIVIFFERIFQDNVRFIRQTDFFLEKKLNKSEASRKNFPILLHLLNFLKNFCLFLQEQCFILQDLAKKFPMILTILSDRLTIERMFWKFHSLLLILLPMRLK